MPELLVVRWTNPPPNVTYERQTEQGWVPISRPEIEAHLRSGGVVLWNPQKEVQQ